MPLLWQGGLAGESLLVLRNLARMALADRRSLYRQ